MNTNVVLYFMSSSGILMQLAFFLKKLISLKNLFHVLLSRSLYFYFALFHITGFKDIFSFVLYNFFLFKFYYFKLNTIFLLKYLRKIFFFMWYI